MSYIMVYFQDMFLTNFYVIENTFCLFDYAMEAILKIGNYSLISCQNTSWVTLEFATKFGGIA
jgi:hypothetical protein